MDTVWPVRLTCLLFDLDGTLVDSAPGITSCLAETVAAFGGPALIPSDLIPFVGPPIVDSVATLTGLPHSRLPEAVQAYRARYLSEGIALSNVFPGVFGLLSSLSAANVPLAIASSKRESHVRAMLELHHLDDAFTVMSGAAEDDSESEKEVVIASALERLAARGVDTSAPVLVGDRSFDVRGAATAGIPAIFASWGYGSPEESEGSCATATDPHHAWELLKQSLPGAHH